MNAEFEAGLKAITQSSTRLTAEIGEYILDGVGKRLRPKLVMQMAAAVGLDEEKAMPLAYAVEMLHTASLLHDDVVDGTKVRRARPTANQKFGERPALLTGDYIFAAGLELVCKLNRPEIVLDMVETIRIMSEGELKELEFANQFHADMSIYSDIIYLKTGRLFEFCTWAPGALAGLAQSKQDALRDYGRLLGLTFQIVDDIIDVTPGSSTTKDAFNDVVEGKSTMPLICIFHVKPDVLKKMGEISDPLRRKELLVDNLSQDMLESSRQQAQVFANAANFVLESQGLMTPEMAAVTAGILAQLDGRF